MQKIRDVILALAFYWKKVVLGTESTGCGPSCLLVEVFSLVQKVRGVILAFYWQMCCPRCKRYGVRPTFLLVERLSSVQKIRATTLAFYW